MTNTKAILLALGLALLIGFLLWAFRDRDALNSNLVSRISAASHVYVNLDVLEPAFSAAALHASLRSHAPS